MLDTKLYLAAKRKASLEIERKISRMQAENDNFVKHLIFKTETLDKNRMLLKLYEEDRRKNVEVKSNLYSFTTGSLSLFDSITEL